MKRQSFRRDRTIVVFDTLLLIALAIMLLTIGCTRTEKKPATPASQPSTIKAVVNAGGPVVLTTSTAEFQVQPSGYVQGFLLKDGKKLTLDEPRVGTPTDSDYVVTGGNEIHFVLDFSQAKVLEAIGKMGRGKRVEIPAHLLGPSGASLQRTLVVEAYDDFPGVLISSVEYKNLGGGEFVIDQAVAQAHRFNSQSVKGAPYDMWSFHGSSYDWGKDDVVKLTRSFTQPNQMGANVNEGHGGGIPVVAFWTDSVGEAIGHVETLPLTLSLPVHVDNDGRVSASMVLPANVTLKAGESYATPRSFLAVYAGIGGLFTSFILELLVYPPVYEIWKWRFEMRQGRDAGGPARV